jgi:hypothetical protein
MIVYITTNLINGRKYIGKDVANRKTTNGYIWSTSNSLTERI